MDTKGINAAIRLRSLIYFLELLKALTAYKLGPLDLIMKPSAFESSRYLYFQLMLIMLARDSGLVFFNSEEGLHRGIKVLHIL